MNCGLGGVSLEESLQDGFWLADDVETSKEAVWYSGTGIC